jgi:4-hydroxy-tetrahydrodipicolinate synthase
VSVLSGIIPPIITPLTPEGDVDTVSLEAVVERQLDAGVHGLFALGSSGEGVYLRDDDRKKVVEVVTGCVSGAVPVFAGAVEATTQRVIEQVGWLQRAGVDVLVVTAPFYANVTQAETLRHFTLVASASSLPVFAYDIPRNVGRKLEAATTIELLQRGTLAGLKDSSGDVGQFTEVLTTLGPSRQASILTGADTGALAALDAGADGIVPGIGNVEPGLFVDLLAAFHAGRRTDCGSLQEAITALTEVFAVGLRHGIGRHASELGGLKTALHHAGVIASASVSEPMSPYPAAARAELLEVLNRMT